MLDLSEAWVGLWIGCGAWSVEGSGRRVDGRGCMVDGGRWTVDGELEVEAGWIAPHSPIIRFILAFCLHMVRLVSRAVLWNLIWQERERWSRAHALLRPAGGGVLRRNWGTNGVGGIGWVWKRWEGGCMCSWRARNSHLGLGGQLSGLVFEYLCLVNVGEHHLDVLMPVCIWDGMSTS